MQGIIVPDEAHVTILIKTPELDANKHITFHGYTDSMQSFTVVRVLKNKKFEDAGTDGVELDRSSDHGVFKHYWPDVNSPQLAMDEIEGDPASQQIT